MTPWTHQNREVEEFPDGTYGFVYRITFDDGSMYIGKKNLFIQKTGKPLKNGKKRNRHLGFYQVVRNHKRTMIEQYLVDSNWKKYCGSIKTSLGVIKREILYLARTKIELTYLEAKAIFEADAIRDDRYLNDNILGKFYGKNLQSHST